MKLWVILIIYEIIPIVLWGLGWYFENSFSKYPDTSKGYKTKIAKKDRETWIYANKVAGKIFGATATMLFILIFVGILILSVHPAFIAFLIFISVCMAFMITERLVKKKIKEKN